MTELPEEENHLSISMLHGEIKSAFARQFDKNFWIWGEVRSKKNAPSGHVYLDLVEKRAGGQVAASIKVMANARYLEHIRRTCVAAGVTIEDGVEVRIRGNLDTYAPGGNLTFQMNHIDAAWTLGRLVATKDKLLQELAREGLLEANKQIPLSPLPLKIALVTSVESAAYHDFTQELLHQDVRYDIRVWDARVQGDDAERSLGTALWRIQKTHGTPWEPDCVVVIRGGGSKTDLATFDSEKVARFLAQMPYPVLTGIGHEIDRSVCDEVAHSAYKTPTAVAQGIHQRVSVTHRNVEGLGERIGNAVQNRLAHAETTTLHLERNIENTARNILTRSEVRLDTSADRLARSSGIHLRDQENHLQRLTERLEPAATGTLRRAAERLSQAERLLSASDPNLLLQRGWSITRDKDGNLLTETPAAGATLVTQTREGLITSVTVEET